MLTFEQKLKKIFYPLIMQVKKRNKGKILKNEKNTTAPISFYTLTANLNNGNILSFNELKGKKVVLVNTASDCGFTGQYAELQQIHEQLANKLVILGFPANDFKEQEKANDKAIEQFCQINYGVTFPLMAKSSVIKGATQNEVYKWLTDAKQNGWNTQSPDWNFGKYLINEKGVLTHYFGAAISPLSEEVYSLLR